MPTPYAGYVDSTEAVTTYLYNILLTNASALGVDSSTGVFYGDQMLLPTTPALCVVPGPETGMPNGAGGRPMLMVFLTYVMVYYEKIQDIQLNTHASLVLANTVKRLIHQDPTLGNTVINCYCSGVEPGVAVKGPGRSLMDASRMVFNSRSKVVLNP